MILDEPRRVDLARSDPRSLLGVLGRAGLGGHGGAGFPTATKIESAIGRAPRLIVNACDGEPLVHKDAAVLAHASGLLADGIALVATMVAASDVVVAVHAGTATAQHADRLVTQLPFPARVLSVPHRYVASEASALASLAAGGEARPITHELPLTYGGPGRRGVPVLVLNAETLARVAALRLDGGYATPTRLITVAGDVDRPDLVEASVDTTVAELVERAAGPTPRRAVLLGGYGGRWLPWSAAAPRTLTELGTDLGAGLIMVQGPGCPVPVVGTLLGYLAAETAGQCGPCMFGLPAIAADWHELSHPRTAVAARERLRRRLPVIERRGACAHPDGAVGMAASALDVFDAHLRGHADGQCNHPYDDEAAPPHRQLELVR